MVRRDAAIWTFVSERLRCFERFCWAMSRVITMGKSTASLAEITKRIARAIMVVAPLLLAGCGVAAAPCRVTSGVVDMVPLVGHAAATPTDACADAIDPK